MVLFKTHILYTINQADSLGQQRNWEELILKLLASRQQSISSLDHLQSQTHLQPSHTHTQARRRDKRIQKCLYDLRGRNDRDGLEHISSDHVVPLKTAMKCEITFWDLDSQMLNWLRD